MNPEQVWQLVANVAAVGALLIGAFLRLSNTLDSIKASVRELKAEVQQDVLAVRADVNLLRASVDGKLAVFEAQTKAELIALRSATERLDAELSVLRENCSASVPKPRKRRGAA